MKNKILIGTVATSLAAAAFIADLEDIVGVSQNILHQDAGSTVVVTGIDEKPILINGVPQVEEDAEASVELFRVGFAHYNYKLVTAIVVARDKETALMKAQILKGEMDALALQQYPQNGAWKSHAFEDPISNEEALELSQKAQVLLTIC